MTTDTALDWAPMSAEEREQFERDGYLIIRGALTPDEVEIARASVQRARDAAIVNGDIAPDGALHLLSAVTHCPELAFLIDHPRVFGYIWSMLGWNIHIYHSHVDVHPHIATPKPFHWEWHQDGGRQNRELETDPRPRMSVKLAFWLSDVSGTGRGNFTILPGSTKTNWLNGPPSRDVEWPQPEGAMQVTAKPGDVVVFDRRIWHARSNNYSQFTRMGAFFGYTYRWVRGRDEVDELPNQPWWGDLNPVQQQLLGGVGDGTGDHAWGHYPATTPLYGALKQRGLLDRSIPALIP